MKLIYTLLYCILFSCSLPAQDYKKVELKDATFGNTVYLSNINGSVQVEGYGGDKIVIEYKKTITGTSRKHEDISNVIDVSTRIINDTLLIFLDHPGGEFSRISYRRSNWSYNWNDRNYEGNYEFDFKLKVPENKNVYVSTINNGDVTISNINGILSAHNVNGSIRIDGIRSNIIARTINGDVDLNFEIAPEGDSEAYTLNGDIVANYPYKLKADIAFKSFNGDFYTNVEEVASNYNALKKKKVSGKGISFKIESHSIFSLGGGGPAFFDFETFNGDVYVKQNN